MIDDDGWHLLDYYFFHFFYFYEKQVNGVVNDVNVVDGLQKCQTNGHVLAWVVVLVLNYYVCDFFYYSMMQRNDRSLLVARDVMHSHLN